jgi:cytidine deaminase
LKDGGHLSSELQAKEDPHDIAKHLLEDKSREGVAQSRLMDIIEFGRIIHAEMSAITDSARKGVSVEDGTLFCTTFPCHLCAKHIVAAGIKRVVFLEPYPKSYASELHKDSIAVEFEEATGKVSFEPFIGVSPFRYRDLFEKGKRKHKGGSAQRWNKDTRRPMIEIYFPSYFEAETFVVDLLSDGLTRVDTQAAAVTTAPEELIEAKPTLPAEGAGPAPIE